MSDKRIHPPSFAPIDFHLAGKVLLVSGIVLFVLNEVKFVMGWFNLLEIMTTLSICMIVVGVYLIFVVPREKS